MNSISLATPVGPFTVRGNHLVFAFFCGLAIGALALYQFQSRTGLLLPQSTKN